MPISRRGYRSRVVRGGPCACIRPGSVSVLWSRRLVGPKGPVNVDANIQQGQAQQAQMQAALPSNRQFEELNTWVYEQFQTGGPQDYKNQSWGGPEYADFWELQLWSCLRKRKVHLAVLPECGRYWVDRSKREARCPCRFVWNPCTSTEVRRPRISIR